MSVTAVHSSDLSPARPLEWKWLVVALSTLAAAYFAMLNRFWVPSGDGEVYTCIARSLVQVDRLLFNGAKAAIAPPGWPLVLSWLMRISPEFWFIKTAIILSMLGGFASTFFILRRFVTDRAAAGIVVLTGTLSSVYPLTYWTHTEAFFCLLGFAAILIAFRISEGRARLWWEVPAMLLLLGFGAFTRWPGLLHAVLVIPILLSGAKRRPWRRTSAWVYVVLVVIACYGTFKETYEYLKLTKAEQYAAIGAGGTSDAEGGETDLATEMPTTVPTTMATTAPIGADNTTPGLGDIATQSKRGPVAEVAYRIGTSGRWFAWLLWQPTRFGQSVGIIDAAAMTFGWLAIALLAVTMIRAVPRRDFFWLGIAIYTGGLCVLWPNPNARYFVPVAPFIVLGVLRGIEETARWLAPDRPGRLRALTIVFIAATLLANLPLLAIDIRIFRSRDFYARYEAGANLQLLAIAQFIREHPPAGTVAVHEKYDNMDRVRWSKYGVRALHLLCDRQIVAVERKRRNVLLKPNDEDLGKALRRQQATYCITQDAWIPWRVWHFRVPVAIQEWLTKRPVPTTTGGWDLWVRTRSFKFDRFDDVPQRFDPPTRMPGL